MLPVLKAVGPLPCRHEFLLPTLPFSGPVLYKNRQSFYLAVMENFVVSARKYRPKTFEEVVGQDHITNTLKNAIDNNQLAQALLFCGPRGVGKTTCARILAKKINNFEDDQNPHLNIFELDAASNNSVEDIRNLIDQVRYPPQQGNYKVYIIDEVHMLSNAAFNAFLKTLEEPPAYAIFILATTEKQKVIPTILSRCQIFDFSRISESDIIGHLKLVAAQESIDVEDEALHTIAQKADGALRDALSLFDLLATFSSGEKITYKTTIENLHILDYDYYFKVTDFMVKENSAKVLLTFDEILRNGFDGHNFISGLSEHFRNLLVSKDPNTSSLLQVSENVQSKYEKQAKETSASFLLSSLNIANQCDLNYKNSRNPRLLVELTLMKMAHLKSAFTLSPGSTFEIESKKKTEPKSRVEEPSNGLPKTKGPQKFPEISKEGPLKIPRISPLIKGENKTETKPEHKELAQPHSPDQMDREFEPRDLEKHWVSYGQKIKAQGRDSEFNVLTQEITLKQDHVVEVKLKSTIQQDILERFRIDLTQYLRQKLQNSKINIKAHVLPHEESKMIYTAKEKFEHLAQKNPAVRNLQKKLGLDTDF